MKPSLIESLVLILNNNYGSCYNRKVGLDGIEETFIGPFSVKPDSSANNKLIVASPEVVEIITGLGFTLDEKSGFYKVDYYTKKSEKI
jgi:hypothetical protein